VFASATIHLQVTMLVLSGHAPLMHAQRPLTE
jgi:hypothetical protein